MAKFGLGDLLMCIGLLFFMSVAVSAYSDKYNGTHINRYSGQGYARNSTQSQ